jgi:alpha-tubulin suppressor-like RCC1 family protein
MRAWINVMACAVVLAIFGCANTDFRTGCEDDPTTCDDYEGGVDSSSGDTTVDTLRDTSSDTDEGGRDGGDATTDADTTTTDAPDSEVGDACKPITACPTGLDCGNVSNGCGGTFVCPSCTGGKTCNTTTNKCETTCTPATTCPSGKCGTIDNGCGTGTLTCPGCTAPQTCGGGGTLNICGCTPTGSCGARVCGTVPDGCGGAVTCGTLGGACASGLTCNASGACVCIPLTTCPSGKTCGTYPDGCGGSISCGVACGAGKCISNVCVTFQQISAGAYHTCGLTSDGAVRCWGSNANGQLGDGTGFDHSSATVIALGGVGTAKQIAAGFQHTCAVMTDGSLRCWGSNVNAAIGDGGTTDRLAPVAITDLGTSVQQVTAGHDHTCALMTDGSVRCWGVLITGMSKSPITIAGFGTTVTQIVAGGFHDCAVMTDSSVKCWGANESGELGDGGTSPASTPKTITALGTTVKQLAAGRQHTCALMTDSNLKCFGLSTAGQVGNSSTSTVLSPAAVLAPVKLVAAGSYHTCALETDNSLYCWGLDTNGQLGDGSGGTATTPELITSLSTTGRQLALGGTHSCAITGDGNVKCWGAGTAGQLGNGGTTDQPAPVSVVW